MHDCQHVLRLPGGHREDLYGRGPEQLRRRVVLPVGAAKLLRLVFDAGGWGPFCFSDGPHPIKYRMRPNGAGLRRTDPC